MKRFYPTLFTCLIAFSLNGLAQQTPLTFPYSHNFDSDIFSEGWTLSGQVGWSVDLANDLVTSVHTNSNNVSGSLFAPTFNTSNVSDPRLKFQVSVDREFQGGCAPELHLWIKDDVTNAQQQIDYGTMDDPCSSNDISLGGGGSIRTLWVDLPITTSLTVYFKAFHMDAGHVDLFYVDFYDGATIGIQDISNDIAVTSNPSLDGKFTIDCKNTTEYFITDAFGREVERKKTNERLIQIDLSTEASGVYSLTVITTDGYGFKKLMKL